MFVRGWDTYSFGRLSASTGCVEDGEIPVCKSRNGKGQGGY